MPTFGLKPYAGARIEKPSDGICSFKANVMIKAGFHWKFLH